jgi:TRAP-type C4-dicarboxylate transport system substrate-binding protein
MSKTTLKFAIATATIALAVSPAFAQKTLNAVTALQTNNAMSQSFLTTFVGPLNKKAAGMLKINYVGGQEVVPPRKSANALKRGQFDMLHAPTAYYIGTVPEGYAMLGGNHGPKAIRKNGGFKLLQEIYAKKAGSHLLAWGESMTSYHMYLAKMPKMKTGLPDLPGMKMRATGTYRPLFRALGATTVNIKSSEVINAIQRGTVDGFGFTDQPASVGMQAVIKYRVVPNFYQTNTVVTINLATWKGMSAAQKKMLTDVGIEYETASVLWTESVRAEDERKIKAAGAKDIVLSPDAAKRYLEIAHGEIWKELAKRSDNAEKLRPLLYVPGKPQFQVDEKALRARHRN